MIQSNTELYNGVDELISSLSEAHEKSLAKALEDALSISSVAGEILGETRVQLRKVRDSSIYQRQDIRLMVEDSISYIDSLLGA